MIFDPNTFTVYDFTRFFGRGAIQLVTRWGAKSAELASEKIWTFLEGSFIIARTNYRFSRRHHPQRADKDKLLRRRVSAKCHSLIKISSRRAMKGDNPAWATRSRTRRPWNIFADYGPVRARARSSRRKGFKSAAAAHTRKACERYG